MSEYCKCKKPDPFSNLNRDNCGICNLPIKPTPLGEEVGEEELAIFISDWNFKDGSKDKFVLEHYTEEAQKLLEKYNITRKE